MSLTTAPSDARAAASARRFGANFRLLMGGSLVSMLGSRVSSIAYPLLVLELTGSPVKAGWASFAALAPSVLAYLPAGALIDRWDPRKAMLNAELGRGLAILGIVALLGLYHFAVIQLTFLVVGLVVLAIIEQILAVFSGLGERRFATSLVKPSQVVPALARSEARTHMVILVGRPLGGLLFGIKRILPFLVDALTFAVAAGALMLIGRRQTGSRQERPASLHLRREIAEGFRWLRTHRFAEIALLVTAGTTLVSQALIMVFFAEAHTRHLPSVAIGVVLAASGAGGACGSAVASRLFRRFEHHLLQIQMCTWTAMFIVLYVWGSLSFLVMAGAMAVMGLTGALGNIELDTFVVRNANTMLGRVTSLDRLTSLAALALGPPLGAFLFAQFRLRDAILSLLLITLTLLAVAATLNRALRTTQRPPLGSVVSGLAQEEGQGAQAHGDALPGMPWGQPAWLGRQEGTGSERTTTDREPTVTRSPTWQAMPDPAGEAAS